MRRNGIFGIALLACGLAVYGLGVYQAWWTLAFVVFAVILVAFELSGRRVTTSLGVAAGIAGSLLLGGMGVFLALVSGGGTMFGLGIACIAGAVVGLALTPRLIRR